MKAFFPLFVAGFFVTGLLGSCKGHRTMDSTIDGSSITESLDSLQDHTFVKVDTSRIDTAGPVFHKVKLVYVK